MKYNYDCNENGICTTKCPHMDKVMIGSCNCVDCCHFEKKNNIFVICKYEEGIYEING